MIEFERFCFLAHSNSIKYFSLKGTNSRPKMKIQKWVSLNCKMLINKNK